MGDGLAKHVLIVGAGVVGLSTACYALQKGHRVTVLERGTSEAGGCSYGNAGLVTPSHIVPLAAPGVIGLGLRWMLDSESPFYVRPRLSLDLLGWGLRFARAATADRVARAAPVLRDLHLASRRCFEELAAQSQSFGLVQQGLLVLCRTGHGLDEEARAAELAARLDVPARVLSAAEAAALEPDVRMDVAGAVHYPLDCHLTPDRLMAALVRKVTEAGARLAWETEVTGWRVSGRKIEAARTPRGDVEADEHVLCAGIWSTPMARDLGLRIPMQAGKGYSLTLERPRRKPRLPAILAEARVAVTPMGHRLRFAGTMELGGLDPRVNPARVRGIVKAVPRYYPEIEPGDFADVPAWCGFRPCSPDGLPYVGRFGRYDNLTAATGHAMMGVSLGPVTGKLVAEVVSGEPPSLDTAALSPDRYS